MCRRNLFCSSRCRVQTVKVLLDLITPLAESATRNVVHQGFSPFSLSFNLGIQVITKIVSFSYENSDTLVFALVESCLNSKNVIKWEFQ